MEINLKAPVIAQHQIMIKARSETIWQLLTDINQWVAWNPNISEARLEGALKPGSLFAGNQVEPLFSQRYKKLNLNVGSVGQGK